MSDVLTRGSVEEYKILVDNVLDTSFRRDLYYIMQEAQSLCCNPEVENIEQKIYNMIDDTMTEFSTVEDVPEYKDVVDDLWEEIQVRQGSGYAGIPFKFKTLNEYVTIEKGELVVFAAGAKQGKSMMLLNCAVDLLSQGLSVLYLDSELNSRLFTARLISHLSGIKFRNLIAGNYSAEQSMKIEEAKAWLKTKKFTHRYIPMFDQKSIYSTVKKVGHTYDEGLDVIIVDYFKSSGEGDAFNSYQELGHFVDFIKNKIAGELNIAAIGAAQATDTGRVADSAKIGRNASTIGILQEKTPEEMEIDGAECGNKKLRIILNRNGMQHAPGEYIDLFFDGNHILYEEARQHVPYEPY